MRFAHLLGIIFFAGCSHDPAIVPTAPLPMLEVVQYQACDDSSECIRVDNGCCDCANGGQTIAINRKFESEFRAKFDCDRVVCTQRAGSCQFLDPVCQSGRCVLGKRAQLFPRKK
jgi:hypothetical protein